MLQRMLGPEVTLVTSGRSLARHGASTRSSARSLARPRARRGRLPLPVHRRRRGLPRGRHALPADADRARSSTSSFAARAEAPHERRAQRRARRPDELRPVTIEPDFVRAGDRLGADLGRRDAGDLHRLRRGERAALDGRAAAAAGSPPSTGCSPPRPASASTRDVTRGRPDGRTVEIQRLIGRSLRGVVDFEALGERTVYLDCDVLQADGGTRCASITGAYVALARRDAGGCVRRGRARALAARRHRSPRSPAASSTASPLLDLDYSEDSTAEVDANVVMTGDGGLVEVQATAERTPLSRAHLDELLALAAGGIAQLRERPGRRSRSSGAARGRRRARVKLLLATRNAHKRRGARAACSRRPRARRCCRTTSSFRPRTGATFAENALAKARAAARGDRSRRRSPTTPGSRPRRSAARPGVRSARYRRRARERRENLAKLLGARRRPGAGCATSARSPTSTRASGEERVFEGAARGRLAARARAATAASATTPCSCPTTGRDGPHDGRARRRREGRDQPPRRRRAGARGVAARLAARPELGAFQVSTRLARDQSGSATASAPRARPGSASDQVDRRGRADGEAQHRVAGCSRRGAGRAPSARDQDATIQATRAARHRPRAPRSTPLSRDAPSSAPAC